MGFLERFKKGALATAEAARGTSTRGRMNVINVGRSSDDKRTSLLGDQDHV